MVALLEDDGFLDQVIHGDALEVLKTMPDNFCHAIVCDPPAGIDFMSSNAQGRTWDSDKGGRESWVAWLASIMKEAMRCLRPGASALVWSLPRTSHWTATALEDAGFEIRDCLYHLYAPDAKVQAFYDSLSEEQRTLFEQVLDSQSTSSSILHIFGSGMPKSHNISVAIDKLKGMKREIVGRDPYYSPGRKSSFGDGNKYNPGKSDEESAWITKPATPEAQKYSGWGSGLKPSTECWWLVRKPISEKNLAENVLRWGTGGLNIDACRVAGIVPQVTQGVSKRAVDGDAIYGGGHDLRKEPTLSQPHTLGRWPSHLLFSHSIWCTDDACVPECPVAVMDAQSGVRKNGGPNYPGGNRRSMFGNTQVINPTQYAGDEGGASRYFQQFRPADEAPFIYASKASRKDRSANGTVNNTHPTTKNTALMKYLTAMITPEGGVVLDMFGGSGSTALGCIQNGFHYILIEQDAHYVEIINARIAHAMKEVV